MCAREDDPTQHDRDEAAEALSVIEDDNLGKPVRVRWIDSGMSIHGWRQLPAVFEDPPSVETVGLWMGENERVVMVGGSRDADNENWGECQLIWKPSITSREWL